MGLGFNPAVFGRAVLIMAYRACRLWRDGIPILVTPDGSRAPDGFEIGQMVGRQLPF